MVSGLSVGDAVARYLAATPEDARRQTQQELQRFVLWCGRGRAIDSLTTREVARYVEDGERSGIKQAQQEALRSFLAALAKQRLTSEDLSKVIKTRRATVRSAVGASSRSARQAPQLTTEGHAQLQAELASLIAERPRVAEELRKAASDGDISENSPLDAMREYQGQLEARIREMEALLHDARVLNNDATVTIGLGSTVLLRDLSTGETLRCFLVDPAEANPRQGKLSIGSPLGQAVLGRGVGEEIEVAAPAGTWRYRIEPV